MIHDVYHDDSFHGMEGALPVYIRERNGELQAKLMRGLKYTQGAYIELKERDQVEEYLWVNRLDWNYDSNPYSMRELHIYRNEWRAGDFRVVIDRMAVPAAELPEDIEDPELGADHDLLVTGRMELSGEAREVEEREVWKRMNRRIDRFVKRHAWALPESRRGSVFVHPLHR
jgi:hypothetical protein